MAGTTKYITYPGGPAGDYTCDGVSDDVTINQALAWAASNPGSTVYIRGPYTYDIRLTLRIGSYTTFTGDATAILRLNDSCMWAAMVPVIGQIGGTGTVSTGIEISGFTIDCNESHLTHSSSGRIHGKGYYNAIHIQGQSTKHANNINIHDLTLKDSLGDGVRLGYCSEVKVHSCAMWNMQHCDVFCIDCANVDVYENDLQVITCSGTRFDNCINWKARKNNYRDWSGISGAPKYGAHGIQFGNQPSGHTTLTNNAEVCDNTINVSACGIQIEDYYRKAGISSQVASIHNNKITGGKTTTWTDYFAGITIYSWGNGLTIEKNTIDGSYRAGILVRNSIASGVKVAVRNNNIINTKKAGSVGGYGIYNKVSTSFTVNASGNYATGNAAGNYYKVTPSTQANSFIDDAIPDGGTDVTEPDQPEEPTDPDPGIYVPGTPSIIDDEYPYIERADDSAYINYVPFQVMKRSGGGSKVVGTSKSPSLAGYNISDFDFEGSQVTFDCIAYDADDLAKILSAFYKKGRSTIEMGGPHKGYKITGVGESHKTPWDSATDDIPHSRYEYSLTFLTEKPYMEKILKRTRGRYIYKSTQFSADDCYAGNLVKNPSFENWPVNTSLNWVPKTTAADNEWRNIKYALELEQWCAVAQTGTDNRIMVSGSNILPDVSGNNKHGLHTIPGVIPADNGGLTFDGAGFAEIPLPDIANAATFSIYAKISTTTINPDATQTVFGIGSSTSDTPILLIGLNSTGAVIFQHRDDAGTIISLEGSIITDGSEHEICGVKSGTAYTLYVDGIQAAQNTATIGTLTVDGATIGKLPRVSNFCYYTGDVYSTRIFSSALNADQAPGAGSYTTGLMQAYSSVTDTAPGDLWIVPPSLIRAANRNNNWRGLAWCPDWMTWVATSITGSGNACITSEDGGVTWLQKSTPGSNAWTNCLYIPVNDSLPTGRLLAFAQSGTGPKTMYSDDKCNTWTEVNVPSDVAANGLLASAYSPSLHRAVIVCYYGSSTKRVIYTDDYGVSYISATCPAQKWTGVVWAENISLFVAISEDGAPKQAMTSPTGVSDSWTLQSTPYSSTTKTEAGTKVADLYGISPTGWNYTTLATTYNTNVNPMYTYELPALTNGDIYRIDNISARLRSLASYVTAYLKVTIQAASLYGGVETQLVEWKENSTSYQVKSLDLAIESATNEKVTIKFYLRSSSSSTRVGADLMGYTAQERTTGGSSIIYNGNEWRGLFCSSNAGLIVAVAQTGNKNRVMSTNTGTVWRLGTTPNDNNYVAIDYSEIQNRIIAIASTGTLDHAIACDGYGTFENVAPTGWTLGNPGQSRSEEYVVDGKYSCRLKGDGVNKEPGLITQPLPFDSVYDAGELYYLSGKCAVTGLTSGSFKADIYAGGSVVKELVWGTNTDTPQEITFKFDTVPSDVYIRVHGSDTPNAGSVCYFDDMVVCKYSDLEIAETGAGITTYGYQNVNPDVRLRGISEVSASASTDKSGGDTSDLNTVYESTSTSYGSPVWTVTLPALTGGSKYKIDQLSCKILSSDARGYTYCKVTVQAASLFSGKETDISMWTTHDTKDYKHWVYNLPYALESATNETVTIRYYIRISRTPYTAYATELGYKYTENVNVPDTNTTAVYLYNTADPRIILKICNSCPHGYMVEINANCTGSYRYVESFEDSAFISNAYSVTGKIARNEENNSCVMSAGSAIVFPFDTLYPVTGTPFIKMFVFSGIPQISIADDSGTDGAPGAFYAVDSNTSVSLENEVIERELDNRLNLGLRGLSKYYVKIEPKTGETCEFTQMLEYASLDTMDAQRPFIYATKEANTFAVVVGDGTGKCSSVIGLGYHDAKIIS